LLAASEFEGIIGRSPVMQNIFATIRRVAPHYRALLITGDTGTGKELVARALHRLCPVHAGRLVVLNCSALVPTLFESELLGHVKGAFTGAFEDKPGLVEHAHEGTLFLDEIGDMLYSTQAKLLRVLQNQEVQRIGSLELRKVDVRVIAATNRDLRTAIMKKHFREDLYYRLARVEIHMPRLIERKEDLPLLERHFIARFAAQYGKAIRGLTPRAQVVLGLYSWPGNVRELENVLGHACMMTTRDTLDIEDFPAYLPEATGYAAGSGPQASDQSGYRGALDEQERLLVLQALQTAGGNQSRAARLLHIGRDAMRYKMKKHQLRASAPGPKKGRPPIPDGKDASPTVGPS
jgi:DNA-binding NtrC family response regulator